MKYHPSGIPTTERIIAPQTSHLFLTSFIFYFSTLSSSQILFSWWLVILVVEGTSAMMDQDEEVALEFSIWIGGNDAIFPLSGVISFSTKGGEGWLAMLMFFVVLYHSKECWSQFWWGIFWGEGVYVDTFSQHDPLPSLCWSIHGSMCYPYQRLHNVAIAINHACR